MNSIIIEDNLQYSRFFSPSSIGKREWESSENLRKLHHGNSRMEILITITFYLHNRSRRVLHFSYPILRFPCFASRSIHIGRSFPSFIPPIFCSGFGSQRGQSFALFISTASHQLPSADCEMWGNYMRHRILAAPCLSPAWLPDC
jgi:hypothetical protein